jgi:hypothetical protein
MSAIKDMSRKTKRVIFGVYFTVLFAFLCFPPLLNTFNKPQPVVLGAPLSIFVLFIIGVLISLGLMALYKIEDIRGEL